MRIIERSKINKSTNYKLFCKSQTQILKFKKDTHLISDQDLISLFMGIIRIIREDERELVIKELSEKLKH